MPEGKKTRMENSPDEVSWKEAPLETEQDGAGGAKLPPASYESLQGSPRSTPSTNANVKG